MYIRHLIIPPTIPVCGLTGNVSLLLLCIIGHICGQPQIGGAVNWASIIETAIRQFTVLMNGIEWESSTTKAQTVCAFTLFQEKTRVVTSRIDVCRSISLLLRLCSLAALEFVSSVLPYLPLPWAFYYPTLIVALTLYSIQPFNYFFILT